MLEHIQVCAVPPVDGADEFLCRHDAPAHHDYPHSRLQVRSPDWQGLRLEHARFHHRFCWRWLVAPALPATQGRSGVRRRSRLRDWIYPVGHLPQTLPPQPHVLRDWRRDDSPLVLHGIRPLACHFRCIPRLQGFAPGREDYRARRQDGNHQLPRIERPLLHQDERQGRREHEQGQEPPHRGRRTHAGGNRVYADGRDVETLRCRHGGLWQRYGRTLLAF